MTTLIAKITGLVITVLRILQLVRDAEPRAQRAMRRARRWLRRADEAIASAQDAVAQFAGLIRLT